MEIQDLEKAIKLIRCIEGDSTTGPKSCSDDGRFVIVRTYSAGVFAGNIKSRNGKEVILENAIRIYYWDGAATLSQLAMEGTSKPSECKFPPQVGEVILTEAIEIINTTKEAEESIKGVSTWRA